MSFDFVRELRNFFHLKIALVSTPAIPVYPPKYGGLETIVGNLGRELAKRGHSVTIFAPEGSKVDGCQIVEVAAPNLSKIIDWFDLEAKMFEQIEQYFGDFDIIHSHNWFGHEYRAKIKNPNLKILHTHHGGIMADWTKNRLFKLNTFAISDWMKSIYEKQGIPTKRVYNGVDINHFPLQEEKGDRFLWFSRMAFFKAPHKAIEIARKTGIKLDLAGATCFAEDANYIKQLKKDCDGEQIRFIGEVSDEEKIRLMQNAKSLLVTACWGEPFGLHVVEAMSCGTGVIAIADGGLKEIIKSGGILCEDEYDMAKSVDSYESIDPKKCRANASLFKSQRMAKNYEAKYREVLAGRDW